MKFTAHLAKSCKFSTKFNKGTTMKVSARNQLKGKIVELEKGAVNALVKIDIGGGNVISATISLDSVKELGLEKGKDAYAIVKATSVMVGVEH